MPDTTQPLPHDPDLLAALARYESLLLAGRTPTPEEVCDDPALLPAVRAAVAQLEAFRRQFQTVAETTPPEPNACAAPPGYEILGELGRGGMGVVYQARQVALGRTVALKMILAARGAGEQERHRFEAEARAIARLQHPGIVQVFEVGEHEGVPYMALEHCPGGTLADLLRERRPSPRGAAALVRNLAEAVQAAHDAKVVHRDLKPGNVLRAADGTLKVADFGLAKQLDEDGPTRTGAVMGTPAYMPPEQARGDKDLGPAADIWALGAILYECLTGRPPFRGATAVDTLRQVLDREPVPVRRLSPQVPRDLETICHKCLQKDPARRYASARELADDLQRFFEGRPIRARPVGLVERSVRWVRRNPIVATLGAAVVLALTVGAIMAGHYAATAHTAEGQLQEKDVALEREADDRITKLAQRIVNSLGGPTPPRLADGVPVAPQPAGQFGQFGQFGQQFGQFGQPGQPGPGLPMGQFGQLGQQGQLLQFGQRLGQFGGVPQPSPHCLEPTSPLSELERQELALLAATKEEKLRTRFLVEALRTPATLTRLRLRAEEALHAALGLDSRRAAEAERLLLARWDAPDTTDTETLDLAVVAAKVDLGPASTRRALARLREQLAATGSDASDRYFAAGLVASAKRLGPAEAARVLAEVMQQTTNSGALQALEQGLVEATVRLGPAEARALLLPAVARMLDRGASEMWSASAVLQRLATSPDLLTNDLSPPQAAAAAALFLDRMRRPRIELDLPPLAKCLGSVAARLPAREAAVVCTAAVNLLVPDTTTFDGQLPGLPEGLIAVVAPLAPRTAIELLLAKLRKTIAPSAVAALALALGTLRENLRPAEAAEVAGLLLRTLDNRKGEPNRYPVPATPAAVTEVAEALAAVTVRLDPAAAADHLFRAAAQTTDNREALRELARGLGAVAARLKEREAAALYLRAVRTSEAERGVLAQGLADVVARLTPEEAAEAADVLVSALGREKPEGPLGVRPRGLDVELVRGLAGPLRRLAPGAAVALLGLAYRKSDGAAHDDLAALLERVGMDMGPKEAATLLLRELRTPRAGGALVLLEVLAPVLARATAGLDPTEAAEVCALYLRELDAAGRPPMGGSLLPLIVPRRFLACLPAVVARLVPDEAARAAAIFVRTNVEWAPGGKQLPTAIVQAALARMRPRDGADLLLRAILETTEAGRTSAFAAGEFARLLNVPAERLPPAEATAVRDQASGLLLRVLEQSPPPVPTRALAEGLASLAAQMGPAEASTKCSRAARLLIESLSRTLTERTDLEVEIGPPRGPLWPTLPPDDLLARSLVAVVARVEPREAADLLLDAMRRTANPIQLAPLAEGLALVAGRLGPDEAAARCSEAIDLLLRTRSDRPTEGALAALCRREPTRPLSLPAAAAVAAVGTASPFVALAPIRAAALPPLPAQTLTDLLKHPMCVGETRRVVLDELSRHYGRPFSDQWDFLRFAETQKLGLDPTSPPARR